MYRMVVTPDTSQPPMASLNPEADLNIYSMVVTPDTSQPLMFP